MKSNCLLFVFFILVSSSFYGQTNENSMVYNSKNIKIIENSVYQIHKKTYSTMDAGLSRVDSTSFRYSKLFLLDVLFETSKSEILSASFIGLHKLSELLKDNPKFIMNINGHTDKIGNSKSNLKLSKKRAKAIKKYLKRKGIKNKRLVANGFGDQFPICESP